MTVLTLIVYFNYLQQLPVSNVVAYSFNLNKGYNKLLSNDLAQYCPAGDFKMDQQEKRNESEDNNSDVRHEKISLSAQVCNMHAESILI